MKQDQKSQATTVTPELIFQVASGFMAAKHLFVANEVGLFEQVADGPATHKDPIPAGHDVVLIANVMHLLSAERNLVLLRLTRQCVPDGCACYLRIIGRTRPPRPACVCGADGRRIPGCL